MVLSTSSTRVKAANKATLSCPCSSRLGSTRPCVPSNISSAVMNACLHTLTTFTSFVLQNVWALFMHGSRWICGSLLASKSIWERLRSGTEAGTILQDALSCKQQHKLLTPMHGCGAEMVSLRFRGSACWGFPLATLRSCIPSSARRLSCLTASLLCRTFRVRGCSCCIAPTLGPIIGSAVSHLRMSHSSRLSMMLQRRRASLGSLGQVSPRMHRIWPHCLCPLEVVGFEAPPGRRKPHIPCWQFEASTSVENSFFLHSIVPRSSPAQCALLRSQGGPFSGLPFIVFPTSMHQRFDSVLFRVLLFRRLRLPLPLSSRTCRCGRPLDVLGHHRAACSTSGVLGRRGFALESAAARICREAGARVSTNIFVRDLDLAPLGGVDGRRLEVVAEGLPVFHGAQLAIDTTLVSPLRADGVPHRQCATSDGAALQAARRRKERTYRELSGTQGRARLVVLAAEVGGRWSEETRCFISLLARAKVRSLPKIIRARAQQSWHFRWGSILSCAAARALASSLLESRGSPGTDGPTPSTSDVMCDWRHLPVEVG